MEKKKKCNLKVDNCVWFGGQNKGLNLGYILSDSSGGTASTR